jgi:hypothetical protein
MRFSSCARWSLVLGITGITGMMGITFAGASSARADETLTSTVPLTAATAHTVPPAPKSAGGRREDPRRFPAFGPLTIAGSTYYTYRFEGHVHSKYSRDAKHPPVEILAAAEKIGLDALVITDHGASLAIEDFQNFHGKLVPFVGREIGGEFGHAVMWNVREDDVHTPSITPLKARADFAHRHGGLIVFAHPGWWIQGRNRDPLEWMTPDAMRKGGTAGDVDAIELWNGVYRTPLPRLIRAYEKLLDAGVYVPIVGNSDFHNFAVHKIGNAHNIALCDQPDISTGLWPAVQRGRIIVTDGPAGVLTVNDQLPGSIIAADGAPLRVYVDVLAPEGGTVQVYSGKTVVQTLELQPGVRVQQSWQIESPAADSYVRMEILRPHRKPDQTPVSLLSNPVIVDVAPLRESWR